MRDMIFSFSHVSSDHWSNKSAFNLHNFLLFSYDAQTIAQLVLRNVLGAGPWNVRLGIWSQPGGGHSHWKEVWGCAAVMTPFFQAIRRSLAYQFTVNAPLLWLPFSSFWKFLHFQPCFGQNSSSLDPIFSKFLFRRPPFFKENPLPRPYILTPAWHTSTKKKLSALPGVATTATILYRSQNCINYEPNMIGQGSITFLCGPRSVKAYPQQYGSFFLWDHWTNQYNN